MQRVGSLKCPFDTITHGVYWTVSLTYNSLPLNGLLQKVQVFSYVPSCWFSQNTGDNREYDLLFYHQLPKVKKSISESVKTPETLFYRTCYAQFIRAKELQHWKSIPKGFESWFCHWISLIFIFSIDKQGTEWERLLEFFSNMIITEPSSKGSDMERQEWKEIGTLVLWNLWAMVLPFSGRGWPQIFDFWLF